MSTNKKQTSKNLSKELSQQLMERWLRKGFLASGENKGQDFDYKSLAADMASEFISKHKSR